MIYSYMCGMGRVLAYGLTMAIPVAGMFAAFLAGWCVWRLALATTGNVDFSGACFGLATVTIAIAYIFRVWKPLRPAMERLGAKRETGKGDANH